MPLKSMRLPPEGTLLGGPEAVPIRPEFPCGLSIMLDEEAIKLLNIGKLPKAGEVLGLEARVVVTSVSEQQTQDRGLHRSLHLQITDMELEGSSKEAADIVYMEDN
jgi:hypothetical protein